MSFATLHLNGPEVMPGLAMRHSGSNNFAKEMKQLIGKTMNVENGGQYQEEPGFSFGVDASDISSLQDIQFVPL